VQILLNSGNKGICGARNTGIKASSGDIIAFIDNDSAPELDWIENIVNRMQSDSTVGACSSRGISLFYPEMAQSIGAVMNHTGHGSATQHSLKPMDYIVDPEVVMYPSGNGMVIRRKVFDEIGIFDEGFLVYGQDDSDIGVRIWDAGYKVAATPNAIVRHLGNYSETQINCRFWDERNRVRFVLKHYGFTEFFKWMLTELSSFRSVKHFCGYTLAWLHNLLFFPNIVKHRIKEKGKGRFTKRFAGFMSGPDRYAKRPGMNLEAGNYNPLDGDEINPSNWEGFLFFGWYPTEKSEPLRWAWSQAGIRFSTNQPINDICVQCILPDNISEQKVEMIIRQPSEGGGRKAEGGRKGTQNHSDFQYARTSEASTRQFEIISQHKFDLNVRDDVKHIPIDLKPGKYEIIFISKDELIESTTFPRRLSFGLKAVKF